jgi:addiction module RelE/StbE family toxin
MQIKYSKIFLKQLAKAPESIAAIFDERVRLFALDKDNLILNNHQLKGKFQGCRSINVGGNWRAIFEESSSGDVFFILFGTHSQLYKK